MEFYRNGSFVGAATTSPYTIQDTSAPLGNNTYFAVMVDSAAARATSAVATITVVNPGVTISSPADGASFATNVINISAVAVLASGSVTNVDFYANGSLIGQDASSPFSQTWNQATPGVHQLRAIGQGTDGLSYTSTPVFVAVASSIVATGSVWKYLDDGSDQGTAWYAPGFDDTSWLAGPAELG
jgi:hypothetical protein